MSGKHTTPVAVAEPTAWIPEDLHEALDVFARERESLDAVVAAICNI